MIYLAILLILCGLLILITALSVETGIVKSAGDLESDGKGKASEYDAEYGSANYQPEDVDVLFPGSSVRGTAAGGEDTFVNFDDGAPDMFEADSFAENDDWNILNSGTGDAPQAAGTVRTERRKNRSYESNDVEDSRESSYFRRRKDEGLVPAVLFDDRSNVIDYESGTGVIDSTFSKYKSIKRIGSGEIETDHDGVNFYLDEKLYRFDFHKVYDVWSGPNYIALPLKGNSSVKLFIIEGAPDFPEKVESNFKEFEKGL